MKRKLHRIVPLLALVASGLAMLASSASATPQTSKIDPGQVAGKLGSPDPREHSLRGGSYAGLVPALLGSQDPRDTARVAPAAKFTNIAVRASARGSYAPSVIASRLGSPDPRDAGAVRHRTAEITSDSYAGDFMFRDYFRGTHWATGQATLNGPSYLTSGSSGLVATRLGSPDPRDSANASQHARRK